MSGTGYDVDTMVREVEAAFERNAEPAEGDDCLCYGADGITEPKCPACVQASRPFTEEDVTVLMDELGRHRMHNLGTDFRVVPCYCGKKFPATGEGWMEFYRHGPRAALDAVTARHSPETGGSES